MSYDTIKDHRQEQRLISDCEYWQEYGSTGKPEPGVTIVRFNEYGDWQYDGIQEGYGSIKDQWQWTRQEPPYLTVWIPSSLTGVPLVQALYRKAQENLA